jgi:hypothetical protein
MALPALDRSRDALALTGAVAPRWQGSADDAPGYAIM